MDRQGIDRMDARLNALGASLFFDEVTVAHAEAAGIDDVFALYAGRAGVLGDVSAGQAASALGFFDPDVVNDVWEGLTRFGSPSWVAEVFAGAMADAAEQRWNAASASAVVALGMQVVESVTPAGLALFTGWREVARIRADASSVVHALRELRGDLHIQCVSAAGLHPLEAEMVTRGAPAAQLHGWKPPYPDPSRFVDRVAAAEAATSERMAHIYGAALSEVELDDLAAAVDTLAATGP
jgi:hypothetical protein